MFRSEQPVLDFSKVPAESLHIAEAIFKKNGTLYSTKPKNAKVNGDMKYCWRMIAFHISTNPQHHCMPVTASFDLETNDENGQWSARLAHLREKELKIHIDNILNLIPTRKQSGTMRWLKALGQ